MDEAFSRRYLSHMGMEEGRPTFGYLRDLIGCHLRTFPFENISKLHYYDHQGRSGFQWFPSLDTFLDRFERDGLGGNCYILNVHFGSLLRTLGFRVEIVRATNGNAHLANKVTVDGRAYYVDVGYGAPLFEPLDLDEQPRFSRRGEEVEIVRLAPDRYLIDRRANGQSFVTKTIEWVPVDVGSFEQDITHSLRDESDNPFMRRIVATVFKPDAAYSVINRKLSIKRDNGVEIHEFSGKEDWMAMMRRTFGFSLERLEYALDFIGARGERLFTEQ